MQALMEVYGKLSKVDEFLPLAKRERYVMTFRGLTFLLSLHLELIGCFALGYCRYQKHNLSITYLQSGG